MTALKDKVAVVTGGSSGIGLAIAQRFSSEGATVVITGRRKDALDEAVEGLGPDAWGIVADASSNDDTDRMIEQVQEKHGRIDVLAINAGVAPFRSFAESDEATFDQVFNINVKGLFFTLQKAADLLNPGSSVILTASVVHKAGFPGASVYAASKAAVRSIGQSAAAELATRGIRVNLLSPGPIETPIYGKMGVSPQDLEALSQQVVSGVPLRRFGTPEEMANVASFLASDESSYITGADIQADGGYSQTVG